MEIQSKDLKKAIIDSTKINPSVDDIPSTLSKVVVPVVDVNPDHNRYANVIKTGSCVNATTSTMFTTPTDKDFYLTSAGLSYYKDGTSTATSIGLEVTPDDGATTLICRLAGVTLSSSYDSMQFSYNYPIKLKRGTNVNLTSDTAVANITIRGVVSGYTVDNF